MFIPIQVDENRAEPLYAQIEAQLRAMILSGHLEVGMLLPSIREFANQLNCSIITIRRVYQDLEQEGLLRTRQGTGTFIADVRQGEREQYRKQAVDDALQTAIDAAKQMQLSEQQFRESFEQMMKRRWKEE